MFKTNFVEVQSANIVSSTYKNRSEPQRESLYNEKSHETRSNMTVSWLKRARDLIYYLCRRSVTSPSNEHELRISFRRSCRRICVENFFGEQNERNPFLCISIVFFDKFKRKLPCRGLGEKIHGNCETGSVLNLDCIRVGVFPR